MKRIIIAAIIMLVGIGSAYAVAKINPRQSETTAFYPKHSHANDETIGAPKHSGGTDAYGCHNGSVPYHCH